MQRSNIKVMTSLIGLVKPLRKFMILAITLGVIGNLFATFISVLGVYALLNVLGLFNELSLTVIFILMGLFAITRGFLRYGEQECNHYIAFKLLALLRDKIFLALRALCPSKLEGKDKGDLISLITSDIELLEVFYAHTISPIFIAIVYSLIMIIFIGLYDYRLAFIALISYLIVGLLIPYIASKKSKDNGLNYRNSQGELSSYTLETMRGLSEVINFNNEKVRLNRINILTNNLLRIEKKMKNIIAHNMALTNTIIFICDLLMLIVSTKITSFDISLITTIALMSSFGPTVALANLGTTLQNTFAAGNRVLDIIQEEPLVKEIKGQKEVEFKDIDIDNVSFKYDDELVLKDINLKIKKDSILAIKGKSGSGKSTLLRLLMRFWEVCDGQILISDQNINKINTEDLRKNESFVTQETHLFHDSIKNNLKIAKLDASDEEIIKACKKASIHDFIMTLPKGYDTEIKELGDSLSGGERQRLGLARAFLHDAPYMLLDEPTSNLDSLNEAMILKSIHDERKDKTVILVSHRDSTLKIAYEIYQLENGRMS